MASRMDMFTASPVFPPSLAEHPLWVMAVIMALWVGMLLCLQWLYSIVDDAREDPVPFKHPLSAVRWVKSLFIFSALIVLVPRLIQVSSWERMNSGQRESLAFGSWLSFILWTALFGVAWWIDRYASPRQTYMLQRFTVKDNEKVDPDQKTRGIIILALIFVMAFASTYVRPRDVPAYEQSR